MTSPSPSIAGLQTVWVAADSARVASHARTKIETSPIPAGTQLSFAVARLREAVLRQAARA